jgi:hypothetical protein
VNGGALHTTEKEVVSNDIKRRIASEEDKSTRNEDDVSGKKRRLPLTRTKWTAWYMIAEGHGVRKARMSVEVDEEW